MSFSRQSQDVGRGAVQPLAHEQYEEACEEWEDDVVDEYGIVVVVYFDLNSTILYM